MKNEGLFLTLMLLGIFAFSICFLPSVKAQEVMEVKVIADSSIRKLYPGSNYGEEPNLLVSTASDTPGESIAYIMFDLKGISGTVEYAEFAVFCNKVTQSHEITAHICSDNTWTETGITWSNAPVEKVSQDAIGSITFTAEGEWYTWVVTSDVKTALGIAGQQLTIVLKSTTLTETGYVEIYSKDGIGGLRPKIDVTYIPAAAGLPIPLIIGIAVIAICVGTAGFAYFRISKKRVEKQVQIQVKEPPAVGVEPSAVPEGSRAAVMFHYVGGIMNKAVETIGASKNISEAIKLMQDKEVEYLVTLENGKPIGIITDRDVFKRVTREKLDPAKTKVTEVMSKPLITLGPSDAIEDAAKMMVTNHISKIPILEKEKLVGIVSEADLIKTLWNLLFLLP